MAVRLCAPGLFYHSLSLADILLVLILLCCDAGTLLLARWLEPAKQSVCLGSLLFECEFNIFGSCRVEEQHVWKLSAVLAVSFFANAARL